VSPYAAAPARGNCYHIFAGPNSLPNAFSLDVWQSDSASLCVVRDASPSG